ncbi:hypothetical protein GLAREA_05731 [Glarea lozoyensis ATCC 20868]|uniref:PPPDE domain-containing protein n=1 Tax=Glarea lozoyensis (strain ATCC 20868 / MF5171) TaxID=1116229 RepID=S3EDN3_GLAL2|nr:uncharacterized protein GLAREA_05731 [Glarea lozoyensis ATCC 20868]EPE36393.1 hypothetical protein GLAREA_05731 [Glarea lozoyensis ATCC 20868]
MDTQSGFANSVIEGLSAPHPRTLKDLFETSTFSIRDKFFDLLGFPVAWDNGGELSRLMLLNQLHDELPEAPESFQHVYLACVPHEGWPISFSHWSVFSHGQFYHLSVPGLQSGAKFQSSLGVDKPENVVLKTEDPYSENSSTMKGRPPLVVYEVGCTDYSPSEVRLIAEWLIKQMPVYDLFEKNCQVFALSMVDRVVMTRRDSSVFVGTKRQIADWASKDPADMQTHVSSWENGFRVQAPGAFNNHKVIRTLNLEGFANNFQQHRRISKAIQVLYQNGPLAPGAYDPTGSKGPWNYAWSTFSLEMKQSGQIFSKVTQELAQDIRRGNFRSALNGRPETKRDLFLRAKRDMENGVAFGKALLYFHATVLYGTISRARRMTAEEAHDLDERETELDE